jgi:hypothetical protein
MAVDVSESVLEELKRASALRQEWSARMKKLQDAGLKDFKLKFNPDKDTTTSTVVTTLNNVLRLREERKFRPLTLDI